MAFTANKHEWAELCAFFQLLSQGQVKLGNEAGKETGRSLPIAYILRQEHSGPRKYIIQDKEVHIVGDGIDRHFISEDFGTTAELVLSALKQSVEDEVESPEGVEAFLDEVGIYNLEAQTDDRTDLQLSFYSMDAPLIGFRIYSKVESMPVLMDGGRAANIKFEQVGVKLPSPTVKKVNDLETPNEIVDRVFMIQRLGGQLKFNDAADKIFRSNLHLIDLHFPRMIGEMVRTLYMDDVSKVSDLVTRIEEQNPLKIKDELIKKHGFYRYKMKEFLLALVNGMRPTKLYNGTDSAVGGMLIMDANGDILCYYRNDRQVMADYLLNNTRFVRGDMRKDHYGYLEKENGIYYMKLNFKVSLAKR